MTFYVWFLLIHIMFLRFSHIVACVSASFLFMAELYPIVSQFVYWLISWWTSGCFHIWLLWIVLWWTSHTGIFLSPCFQFWEACISSRIIYMLFSLYEMFFPPCMHFIQLNPLLNSSFILLARSFLQCPSCVLSEHSVHIFVKVFLSLHCNYWVPFISLLYHMILRAGTMSYSGFIISVSTVGSIY